MGALTHLQPDSLLSYLVAFALPALDAVAPVLPAETVIVALGVATAGRLDPLAVVLVALAAAGAFAGDNLCYLIGRHLGPWAERRFFTTERGAKGRAWAERSLSRYGILLIVACRFVPGGRTAVTLTCGATRYPRRRFVPAAAAAGAIWATYAFAVGRIGGQVFQGKPWAGLLAAFGIVVAVSLLVEAIRRAPRRWRTLRRTSTRRA